MSCPDEPAFVVLQVKRSCYLADEPVSPWCGQVDCAGICVVISYGAPFAQ